MNIVVYLPQLPKNYTPFLYCSIIIILVAVTSVTALINTRIITIIIQLL